MASPLIVLFSLACTDPCAVAASDRAKLEREIIAELVAKGFEVKPATPDMVRPTGESATIEPADEAGKAGADRLVVLDLEAGEKTLWVTHFLRGAAGTWAVGKSACGPGPSGESWICPSYVQAVAAGLRPRRGDEIDFSAALRAHSKIVGRCVAEEDDVPPLERIYGRVEMELEARPTGDVKVKAIAPVHVARSRLGQCLRRGMEQMYVGPFEGKPVKIRVPLDL